MANVNMEENNPVEAYHRSDGRTYQPLRGRVAIVTGGASGIGRAVALRLARAGADIALMSLTQERVHLLPTELKYFPPMMELVEARQAIEAVGARCLALEGDVSVVEDVEGLVRATLDQFGRIDILVNNAATSCVHPILGHTLDTWVRVIEVNLLGAFRCIQAVLPHLIENGWGRIINIGSTAATMGFAG
jgi:3-hydroxybutyrate dehydrogenase